MKKRMNLYVLVYDFLNCHGIVRMGCRFSRV